MQMTDQETKEEMPQPEHFEQEEPVEQPAPVVQIMKKTVPVKEKKTMLSLEDRMKEFRDMMLERGVGAFPYSCNKIHPVAKSNKVTGHNYSIFYPLPPKKKKQC